MSHFHEAQTPEDLPPEMDGEPIEDDGATEDSGTDDSRFEDSAKYRDDLIDAGRGHLVVR